MNRTLTLVGEPTHTEILAAGLARLDAGLRPRLHESLTGEQAHRSPGSLSGRGLAVFCWPPGRDLPLEAEAYADGVVALHAWWDAEAGSVGPLVGRRLGMCPACNAAAFDHAHSGQGEAADLGAWVAATAALEIPLVGTRSTLRDRSLTWCRPCGSVGIMRWARQAGCRTPGCASQA